MARGLTLARLQQATTLGALLVAALWAWLCWRAGHNGWALAGVLLVVGGYALVLALEFALLRLAHGSDPTPRAIHDEGRERVVEHRRAVTAQLDLAASGLLMKTVAQQCQQRVGVGKVLHRPRLRHPKTRQR